MFGGCPLPEDQLSYTANDFDTTQWRVIWSFCLTLSCIARPMLLGILLSEWVLALILVTTAVENRSTYVHGYISL